MAFDFQAAGEFQLVEADGVNIQARTAKQGSGASVIDRLAFELGDHVVEIEPASARLRIDGELVGLISGNMFDLGDGASIVRTGNAYNFAWPGEGLRPSLQTSGNFISYQIAPDRHPQGLLGDADGDPNNDLMLGDGTRLPATSSPSAIHGAFADSWRITDEESLFTYGPGESTDTFTDRTFPETVISIGDYSDEVLAEATAHCTDAGVPDGRPFENCLLDWAVTRDQAFVEAAADDDIPSIEPGARQVGADSVVTESFEASVAPNFSSPKYGTGAGTGRFAGPFGRDGRYSASVSMLPGHDSATVQFDLITVGTWPTDGSSPVTITINGSTAWTGDVVSRTPTAQGTTPGGQPYAVYPLSVTVPHSDEQLTIGVSALLPQLGANRAFGVDNLRAALDLVPEQSFDVSLPFQAPTGSAPGSGNLETIGSEDEYRFALETAGAVQVDVRNCSGSLASSVSWTLAKATDGETVATGGCASKRSPVLAVGSYELSFTNRGRVGTYEVAAVKVPDPQRFSVTVPVVASNGFPAQGAGNLETTASEDGYEFSTPVTGGVIVDLSGCSSALGTVSWRLVDTASVVAVASGASCDSALIPNLTAGRYRLEVTSNGRTGTYVVGLDTQPAPQEFAVSLPALIQDGSPAGAGNLETTASQDVYSFQTSVVSGLQIDLSTCSSSLSAINWRLVNEAGSTIQTSGDYATCSSRLAPNVPAGRYTLVVSRQGRRGTYRLGVLSQPPPQTFQVMPPVSISNGSPAAGAGNLETTASEDLYAFTTTASGTVQMSFSECSSSLTDGAVEWSLVRTSTGATVSSSGSYFYCSSTDRALRTVRDVPADTYQVRVSRNGSKGTYKLRLLAEAPQRFDVSLPASIADGSPAAGAGNLETTASQDIYRFDMSAAGNLLIDVSNCPSSLYTGVHWKLINEADSNVQATPRNYQTCSGELVREVPAGQYRLEVSNDSQSGTYQLGLSYQPPPDRFEVSLPTTISDGSPAAGAGNMETTSSEDIYTFEASTAGGLQIDLSSCSSASSRVRWTLISESGPSFYDSSNYVGCSSELVKNVPAGRYRLTVSDPGHTGTYRLAVFSAPPPQTFQVTSPASIADGSPSAGAGNLETTASEDRYQFTLPATGIVSLSFSECTSSLSTRGVDWRLVDDTGQTIRAPSQYTCGYTYTLPDIRGGTYQARVSRNGYTGTYKMGLVAEAPQKFDVSLPASIADGSPAAGAGNLETIVSQDVYSFETSTPGGLQLNFSSCASTLPSVNWKLINSAGTTIESLTDNCGKTFVPDVPPGRYKLEVTKPRNSGTYKLNLLLQPLFDVVPPVTISNGSPGPGAGNLETTEAEDHYRFTSASGGAIQLDFSECGSTLRTVNWKLVNEAGTTIKSATADCGSTRVPDVPAGTYRVIVSASVYAGTYKLKITAEPPQVFDVALPISISNGSPAPGAGNLETTTSRDDYRFTTTASGNVQLTFSECAGLPTGGTVTWTLVNAATAAAVSPKKTDCGSTTVPNVPAGAYRVIVSRVGVSDLLLPLETGTYKLRLTT